MTANIKYSNNLPTVRAGVAWGAVSAGTLLAIALYFVLLVLGLAIGASSWKAYGGNLGYWGLGSGLWWMLAILGSVVLGSYISGSLAGSHGGIHGLLCWALTMLIILYLPFAVLSNMSTATVDIALTTNAEQAVQMARDLPRALGERFAQNDRTGKDLTKREQGDRRDLGAARPQQNPKNPRSAALSERINTATSAASKASWWTLLTLVVSGSLSMAAGRWGQRCELDF